MRMLSKGLMGMVGLLFSSVAFAEEVAASASQGSSSGLMAIGVAIAVGLATFGAASGQGKAAANALDGIARNPSAKGDIFTPMILSLVFMEFQALLGFAIAFLLMGKF